MTPSSRIPSIFLAHGSPLLLDDAGWVEQLGHWAQALPRPRSILMISAHWLDAPVTLGATRTVPLVYDFYGFPKRYYRRDVRRARRARAGPRVKELLAGLGPVAQDETRGLDHGAYVPLVAMYSEGRRAGAADFHPDDGPGAAPRDGASPGAAA